MTRSPRTVRLERDRVALGVGFLCLLALIVAGPMGCPSQFSRIDQSALSEEDKALAKLFAAESSWIQTKEVLADVLTELAFAGVALEPDVKLRLKQVLAGGNLAIQSASAAIERGDVSAAGAFAGALRQLQAATRALTAATPVRLAGPMPDTSEEVTTP